MQKTLLFTLCLASATCPLAAQNVWQKTIPPVPQSVYFVRLSQEGDQYFIGTQNSFAEVDELGSVTGYHRQSFGPLYYWTSTIKKYSATTGHPYFLMTKRGGPSASSFSLLEYRPGWGVVNGQTSIRFILAGIVERRTVFGMQKTGIDGQITC